jgi:hypothetical protein
MDEQNAAAVKPREKMRSGPRRLKEGGRITCKLILNRHCIGVCCLRNWLGMDLKLFTKA